MKYKGVLFIFLCCFLLGGCLWPFSGRKAASNSSLEKPLASVEIINDYAFNQGGSVLFVPFSAGPKAEAGPLADHVALLMVKGAVDILGSSGASGLRVVAASSGENSDFVLEGRIDVLENRGGLHVMGVGGHDGRLQVSGQIRDRRTGEVVALISGDKRIPRDKDLDRVAYAMGCDIARNLGGWRGRR